MLPEFGVDTFDKPERFVVKAGLVKPIYICSGCGNDGCDIAFGATRVAVVDDAIGALTKVCLGGVAVLTTVTGVSSISGGGGGISITAAGAGGGSINPAAPA